MVIYKNVVAVYIGESHEDNLIDLCNKNNFEFEHEHTPFSCEDHEDWQDFYRKQTGISGKIIRCYITNRTNYRNGYEDIFNALETLDFTIMVNHEIS